MESLNGDIQGRAALVTGANRGCALAISRALTAEQCNPILTACKGSGLQRVQQGIVFTKDSNHSSLRWSRSSVRRQALRHDEP